MRTSWRFTMRRTESQNSRVHYDVTSLESWETWKRAQHRCVGRYLTRWRVHGIRKYQRSERGVKGTDSQTRDRECTAKSGDEQFCLKEHVESFTRRRMTLMISCGIERNRLLWWSSRSRLGWTNLYYPEVIVYSVFSHFCSVSLCSFLVSRTYSSRDMRAVHIMHDTDVVCMSHESQAKKKSFIVKIHVPKFHMFLFGSVLSSCVVCV